MVEYASFTCPHCAHFHETVFFDLKKNYIDTGKVHFTYVPFSFLGPESLQAAEAAYCAMDQGKFWDFHDILFANQAGENAGNYSDSKLKGFAQQLKLDTAAFNACFDANTHEQKVLDNLEYGRGKGVNATPYFIVNDGTPVDMNALEAAVDAALAAAQ